MNPSVTIIGYGRLGRLFEKALKKAGLDSISIIRKRSPISFLSDVNLICVPDSEIRNVVHQIVDSGIEPESKIIAHCSGTIGLTVFDELKNSNLVLGCLHPLMAITEHSDTFSGITFDVCGDEEFITRMQPVIESLHAEMLIVSEEQKTRLHIAAVLISNYLVTLMGSANEAMDSSGIPNQKLQKALLPLISSVLTNLESQSPANALTGPLARSDKQTIREHLNILEDNPELKVLYSTLGRETLRMLEREGKQISNELKKILDET